ncbi:MAG: DMT family transporter [Acidimicrobiia bacterium]|nr:DMT family transporter [Acidimicrobiia bacterium]
MSENASVRRWATLAMFFNVVAWGMSWVNVRAVLPEVGAGQLGAMRYLIASAVMLPIWLYRGRPLPGRSDWPAVASLGLFGFCLYNLGINYGEQTVNAGTGSMLISCIPVLVILLGVLTGREKVGLLAWLGIILSMVGVVLTAAGSEAGLTFNLGSLLILGAALCAAIQTLISKSLTQRYAAVDVTTWAIWLGTLGLLPFSHDLVGTAGRLSGMGWVHLLFLGMVPAALCYTIWSWVLVKLPITTVMSAVYAIPIFSVFFGWLILGEQPSLMTLLGGAVTLAGVAWVQTLTRKQRT